MRPPQRHQGSRVDCSVGDFNSMAVNVPYEHDLAQFGPVAI